MEHSELKSISILRLILVAVIFSFSPGDKTVSAQILDNTGKCIMVFGAHADDVDEIAGGTFAKYIADGYMGVYVCVTNNLAGCNLERTPFFEGPRFTVSESPFKYPAGGLETNQIRSEEMRAAAAVYGAIPEFLDFCEPEIYMGRKVIIYGLDDYIKYNPPGRKQINLATRYTEDVNVVYELLKKYEPDIVITHTLGGEKLDHEGTAYMVYLAFKKAIDEDIPVGKLWMTVNGWLLDNTAQKNGRGRPDVRIDVSKYLKVKYKALNKHLSQNGGFGREYVTDGKIQPKEKIEEFITVIDNTK